MSDLEARELQRKMNEVKLHWESITLLHIHLHLDTFVLTQETEERDATKKKVDKKMETRALKKEMKKDLGVDKCKQQ